MFSIRDKAVFLLLLGFGNLLYIIWIGRHLRNNHTNLHQQPYSYRGHDYPEFLPLPQLEDVYVVMEETVHYLPLGEKSEEAWHSLVPAGDGYVRLGPDNRTFTTTMFHELHCLRMINRAFSRSPSMTMDHLRHCLNYIRQGILCSPDLGLEPGKFEEKDYEVERTTGIHICRNWDIIYDYMDANYASWSGGRDKVVRLDEH
ncbi:hypothetical protein BD310DRAFT_941356 [Dichomitus squalens]|uniref:Oxidase ustYa n=1 Tax=Dichomitus squalens TaxID=114155 RepID=A0A4Q9PFB4_9APHY|nr:hypothetical protein BD310DRAFT_941356 [Dichomitus squalens]